MGFREGVFRRFDRGKRTRIRDWSTCDQNVFLTVEFNANRIAVFRMDPIEMRQLGIRRESNRRPGRSQRLQLMRAYRCSADAVDDVRRA
jgi:hypothetical protein